MDDATRVELEQTHPPPATARSQAAAPPGTCRAKQLGAEANICGMKHWIFYPPEVSEFLLDEF